MPPATSIYNVHFDIVHGCQLRCLGCPNSTLQPKVQRIAVEDFDRALRNIDVERIHTLQLFNFGEPLLHKELARIVECIPRQKWKVSIVEISTNAQFVDWDEFEKVVRLEVVNRLVVSCDGDGTPEEYERLRPPSRWEKLLEFLDRARQLRDRWAPAMQLATRTVCDPDPPQNRQRWRDLLVPAGWTPEFRRWQKLPESEQNLTGRPVSVPSGICGFVAESDEFKAAGHPWHGQINLLYVDHDGTVVPCCQHPQAGRFGNLFTQTYNEILRGSARSEFVALMRRDRASMPICGACDVGPVTAVGPSVRAAMDMAPT
jgi:radical SAM protein with 4Fe4S-binding SPASM domain